MSSAMVRLAMAQMRVDCGQVEANLGRAAEMIAEGAAQGCSAVLLPECLDVGWTHPDTATLARPIPGPSTDVLGEAARRHGVWVCAGLAERDGARCYNAAALISPSGEVVLKYRKINVLEIAQPSYEIGDRLGVADTPIGKVGVNICADNWGDVLVFSRALGRMGARLIVSPCAWAMEADHDNEADPYGGPWQAAYAKVARMFDIPIVGVSGVGWIEGGPWDGRKCIGCSMAVGRDGELIASAPYGVDAEVLIPVDLDVTPMPVKGTEISGWIAGRGDSAS